MAAPDTRVQAALAFYHSGRIAEAETLCRELVAGEPRNLGALNLLGAIEARRGDHALAAKWWRRALSLAPASPRTLANLGLSLRSLGSFEEALDCVDRALRYAPDYALGWYNRGVVLRDLERLADALESYDRAIALEDTLPDAHSNRGDVLQEMQRFEAAVSSYDRSIALRPAHADTYASRGVALWRLGQLEQALSSVDRAVALAPLSASCQFLRGTLLHELGRYAEAITSFELASAQRPTWVQPWIHRGHALREAGAFEGALAAYERATGVAPEDPDARWNVAFSRMLLGELATGLREYEWRWRTPSLGLQPRPLVAPLWLGSPSIAGKTLLVYAEQGYGDTVQMIRYARELEARGASVVLEVPARLRRLLTAVQGVEAVVTAGEPLPSVDFQCPIMSLPLALGTRLETIPAHTPYLRVDPKIAAAWRTRLGPRRRPRVGLAWSGNAFPPKRSIPFASILPLLDAPFEFVSLQRDVDSADAQALLETPSLRHFGADQEDFADAAGLIEAMDLVVSIDTAVAHVAGALGKPLWILLPFAPDWRWLLHRRDSPWYPTAELFRQPRAGDWKSVISEVRARLLAAESAA